MSSACVADAPRLHILHVPVREYSRQADGEPRWCFECRERVGFERVVTVPVDEMSYYGPSCTIECERGHADGDLFPGRFREWGDE